MTKLATAGTRGGMRGRAPQKADGDSTMRLLVVSHDAADDFRLLGTAVSNDPRMCRLVASAEMICIFSSPASAMRDRAPFALAVTLVSTTSPSGQRSGRTMPLSRTLCLRNVLQPVVTIGGIRPLLEAMSPECASAPSASVTPARRTPSMNDKN